MYPTINSFVCYSVLVFSVSRCTTRTKEFPPAHCGQAGGSSLSCRACSIKLPRWFTGRLLTVDRAWPDPGLWFLDGGHGCTGWFYSVALPCCHCCLHHCCCCWLWWWQGRRLGWVEPSDGWKETHMPAVPQPKVEREEEGDGEGRGKWHFKMVYGHERMII